MSERRKLNFGSLDEVMPEVDRLLVGYEAKGRWSLGQICQHLAKGLHLTVDGKPIRGYALLRWTVGPFARRHMFRTRSMPSGIKLPVASLAPGTNLDDRAEAEALRASIRVFLATDGPYTAHPIFGPLSEEEWRQLHAIHAAHHLGFLKPKS